jgi:hypothetical protein
MVAVLYPRRITGLTNRAIGILKTNSIGNRTPSLNWNAGIVLVAEAAVWLFQIVIETVLNPDLLPNRRRYICASTIRISTINSVIAIVIHTVITGCFRCFSSYARLTLGFDAADATARRIVRLADTCTAGILNHIVFIDLTVTVIVYAVTVIIRYTGGNTATFRIIAVCQTIAVFIEDASIVADLRACSS